MAAMSLSKIIQYGAFFNRQAASCLDNHTCSTNLRMLLVHLPCSSISIAGPLTWAARIYDGMSGANGAADTHAFFMLCMKGREQIVSLQDGMAGISELL